MIRHAGDRVTEIRENMRGGEGAVTFKHFFSADEFKAKSRLCAQLILPPGASIGRHEHLREDEVYIILRGSGEIDDGRHREPVAAGDAVLTGNGQAHAIRNTGVEPLELIAVIMQYPTEP